MRRLPADAPPIPLLMYLPVPWVFILGYLVGAGLQMRFPVRIHDARAVLAMRVVGAVLIAAGGALAVWCLAIFRHERTTTIPFKQASKLVTRGPYGLSRNPMYVSLSLIYLGEAGVLVQAWPLLTWLAVLAYVDRVVIPYEESRLREAFASDYQAYFARVGRWVGRG